MFLLKSLFGSAPRLCRVILIPHAAAPHLRRMKERPVGSALADAVSGSSRAPTTRPPRRTLRRYFQTRYSEGSTRLGVPARSFGVPQDDGAESARGEGGRKAIAFLIAFFLLVLPVFSHAAMKEGDALPTLDSFHLEGRLPEKLKGRVILLDFWASWCEPCKSSFPAMEALHKAYADRGLTIVAVSVDEKREDMERFVKRANVSFTVGRDSGHKLVAAADVATMPTSFLIDRTGKIRYLHSGFRGDETVKKYREQIELLLKEPAPR